MKLLLPYLTAQGLALSGLLAQQNVVINFVPNATFNGSLNENADHPNDTIFTSAGGAETAIISTGITVDDTDSADFPNLMAGRGTFAPFTLTGIDADGATVTGTFTIEVTVTTNNTVAEFPIQRGGVGAPGVGNGTVDPGETITVSNPTLIDTVTGLPSLDFVFDGFTGIFVGAVDANELAIVNDGAPFAPTLTGNAILPTTPGEDPFTPLAELAPTITLGSSAGGFTLNGVEAQFSVAPPEPQVVLSTTASTFVGGDFTVDATFSDEVTGLIANDFIVTNGTASNVLPATGAASTFTVTITPSATGDITVELPAAAAQLGALDSLASNTVSTFAIIPPEDQATVTLSTTASEPVSGPYTVDVIFSEDITDLDAADFSVINGTVTEVLPATGPASVYTVTIEPIITGDVEVILLQSGVTDADDLLPAPASNTDPLVTSFVAPTVPVATLSPPFPDGIEGTSLYTMDIIFSEDVMGLTLSDFQVDNGSASNLITIDSATYTLDITPTTTGPVTLTLAASAVEDLDGDLLSNVETVAVTNIIPSTGVFLAPFIPLTGNLGAGQGGNFFPNPQTFDGVTDLSLDDINVFDLTGDLVGTLDLTFQVTSSLGGIRRGGQGGFGTAADAGGSALINNGETLTLNSFVASDLTGSLVGLSNTNIQITSVFLGNGTDGDGATVNGMTVSGAPNGAISEEQRTNIPSTNSLEVIGTGGDGFSFNGLAFIIGIGEPSPVDLEIVDCGFEGDDFFIELAGGTTGLIVTSSDTLDFANASTVNATVDPGNPNRFLIPLSERNAISDFFRVEEQ